MERGLLRRLAERRLWLFVPVWLLFSWGIVNLIGAAWSDCADLDAPDRVGLLFLYLPLTLVLTGLGANVAFNRTWTLHPVTRGLLIAGLVGVIGIAVLVWAIPYGGDANWVGVPFPPEDASAYCGPGGIPTWWPAWLPS